MATNLATIDVRGPAHRPSKPFSAGLARGLAPFAGLLGKLNRSEARPNARARVPTVLTFLALLLGASATCAYLYAQLSASTGVYVSTATEMQMLSQRIANSAQQAVQGSAPAFTQLREGHRQFVANLQLLKHGGTKLGVTVPPSPGELEPALQSLERQWQPVQKNIALILEQEKSLLELRQQEELIDRLAPQLAMRALQLSTAARDARESAAVVTFTKQLHLDAANFDFVNATRLLSTDRPNPQVASQLGTNARQYLRTLKALLGEAIVPGVTPIAAAGVRGLALELQKAAEPFAQSIQSVLSEMQALARAKQASRDVFAASEGLLSAPMQLALAYERSGGNQGLYAAGAVVSALLALTLLALLGRTYLSESRSRAEESERTNRANQDAILRLLDEIGNLAAGDLTVRAKVTEEMTGAIADSINYTIDELRRLVTGINSAAQHVTAATQEAQTITGQLLVAAQKQAAEIHGTGQLVAQMTVSMQDVSKSAGDSATVAKSSLNAAEKGAHAVQGAIRGMNEIRDQIQETSKRIKRLGESSQEIGEIVQLISNITEQTNVLALNAAIQAASAGEAGRGFTVVAEEVQRLAERSAEATKHIAAIVKSIQRDTLDAVGAMEKSTRGVVDGTKTADEAGEALREIQQVSGRLAELIASISTATDQQAAVAAKVAGNMKAILAITQLTTEGTKKTALSASRLTALAEGLKKSVAGFKLA